MNPRLSHLGGLILGRLRAHRMKVALALLSLLGATAMDLLAPWPLKLVIDYVLLAKPLPASLSWLKCLLGAGPVVALLVLSASIAVIALASGGFAYLQTYLSAGVGHAITDAVRRELFAHVQRLSLAFHARSQSGELLTRVGADASMIRDAFADWAIKAIADCTIVLGVLAVMLALNWQLALAAFVTLPALAFAIMLLNKRIKLSARKQRKHEGRALSRLNEVLSTIALVKAFGRESHEETRFALESAQSLEAGMENARMTAAVSRAVAVLTALATAATVLFGAWLALRNRLTPGDLLIFVAYVQGLFRPIRELCKLSAKFSRARASMERIEELLRVAPDAPERPDAIEARALRGDLEFDGVRFGYRAEPAVLRNVSLRLRAGEHVAITGSSGAGKSTLVSLLLRLYEPQQGSIRIDGRDLRDYTRLSLRREIGIVLQDTVLVGASVRENIAYGTPEASNAEIEAAARAARAHEFILQLPDGYDTVVGERGGSLSGGQRQRICLARALIKQPSILVLDEPTSAVDAESALLIEQSFRTLFGGKTLIVIGHQFHALHEFDRVLTLHDGVLSESVNSAHSTGIAPRALKSRA